MLMKVSLSSRRALKVDGAKKTKNLHDVYMTKFYFLVNLPRIVAVFRPKKGIILINNILWRFHLWLNLGKVFVIVEKPSPK